MNVILCGCSGTGKSSAIEKILTHFDEPIYGFWTRKLAPLDNGECSVYFHPCQEPITFTHRVGICKDRHAEKFPQVFDTVGVRSLTDIPEGSIVMMDEIGFMENDAKDFINAVFKILDGNFRVIAAVRDKNTPLLDAIRHHAKSYCIQALDARSDAVIAQAVSLLKK